MGSGAQSFRVAFVLGGSGGEYDNIDDGIYQEPLTIRTRTGSSLVAQTAGGGSLDLALDKNGERLTGSFHQGRGRDSQATLVGEDKSYPVTLGRGGDYLHPRLLAAHEEQKKYTYAPPKDLSDGWATSDLGKEEADVPKIESAVQRILRGKDPHVHALVVVKGGRLVLDEYFYGYGPEDPHPVQSVTKSLFSLLFGIAQAQGLCRPDQRLYDLFPSYRQGRGWEPGKEGITLCELLTMTSGLGCDDLRDPKDCSWAMVGSTDWLDFSLSLPLSGAPGTHFVYCGACLMPLGAVLEKQSRTRLTDFAQRNLWDPLDIPPPAWWEGPGGEHSPAFGLSLKPRDMAKIGCLVLNKGRWKGRQVVPEKWIEQSTAVQVPRKKTGKAADYGFLWWEREVRARGKRLRVMDAWGVGGQHIFIVPAADLVCVMTGGNYKDGALAQRSYGILQAVLEAFEPLR